ncbi:MAG: SPASM domain-containing protein [Nitrospirae bacterium]|nr:SPASM domain-containing protein [Nitrospirota bacterium]
MITIFKPTLRCNIRCTHCFVGDQRTAYRDMSREDAVEVLSRIPAGSELILHGGEPTLLGVDYYRDIFAPYRGKFHTSIQTNLMLIGDRWVDFIGNDLGGRMSTSFDVAASLRPIDTALWLENVQKLKYRGIYPYVVSMLWQGNEDSHRDMYAFFDSLDLSFRLNPVENIGYAKSRFGQLRHRRLKYAEAVIHLFDQWFMAPRAKIIVDPCAEILSFLVIGNSVRKCPFTAKCALHFVSINPDGSVFPCGGFDDFTGFNYGNLLTNTLQEVMNSPVRLEASRRGARLPDDCYKCSYFPVCNGGCRLEAYSYHGDIYKATSLCDDYMKIFRHIEGRLQREKGDVNDWWFALYERREEINGHDLP